VHAFGFSGVVAHTSFDALAQVKVAELPSVGWQVSFQRRSFPWRDSAPHPFLQTTLRVSDEAHVHRSPTVGALHALVADHVVQGRVIFPAAAHLEMARAAHSAVASASSGAGSLHETFFLHPLALRDGGQHVECAITGGRFEVRSGDVEQMSLQGGAVHSSGALALASSSEPAEMDACIARGSHGARAAAAVRLYDVFHSLGLQYGPAYRTLARVWEAGGTVAVGLLRARVLHQGTAAHPADLDDALCLSAAIPIVSLAGRDPQTRLPYAVDEFMMRGLLRGEMWAVCRTCHPPRAILLHRAARHDSHSPMCVRRWRCRTSPTLWRCGLVPTAGTTGRICTASSRAPCREHQQRCSATCM